MARRAESYTWIFALKNNLQQKGNRNERVVGLNKSQDRKMKDRKMAFGIMPGKLTMMG